MRLRLTVRRHNLPEIPIIWVVDTTTSPTIAQLLEQVNDAVPIEAGEWGFEDYAVEVKGNNGVNYECLHYQLVSGVMKEEDEVVIRPLLTQDLKIRKISGRHQISADGKHLVDGLAYGRPLLRRPADRPAINIPPRKKRRIVYEEEDAEGGFAELEGKDEADSGDDNNQLVLHADFDDDSEEDDDDFAPGGDEDEDEDGDSEEDSQEEDESSNGDDQDSQHGPDFQPQDNKAPESAADQLALADVPDQATRAKIRKLHSAFPISALAVCKYILIGTGGDMGEAYEALNRGFVPVKSKRAITEISQELEDTSVPKSRLEAKKSSSEEAEDRDRIELDPDESHDPLVNYYDQNGFPPGSITSGKLTSFMADATKSCMVRPDSRRSNSVTSNKSVRFAIDEDLSNGLASTPFIDQELHEDDETEDSSEDSSDEEDTTSSDSSDSSEEEASQNVEASDTSSESDSDSSGDSSSDDDSPEEISSKSAPSGSTKQNTTRSPLPEIMDHQPRPAGQGRSSTRHRNLRRKQSNTLNRYKERGILPESTTISEFQRLDNVDFNTSPEEALAALEIVRAAKLPENGSELAGRALVKSEEFELRRQELLASLSAGGIEVGHESSRPLPSVLAQVPVVESPPAKVAASQLVNSHLAANALLTATETHQITSAAQEMETSPPSKDERLSAAPEASALDSPLASPQPQTSSAAPPQGGQSRRSKLNVGAGRRLLFGALGIKTPKTKKDEEKVRSELMKYVRPVKAVERTEDQVEDADNETAAENSEAWREKIIYRAVECVQDGVELSEPPFPFVQRWDPQQQNPWFQKGNRGGKRKKDLRDQAQYYNDDPRLSKKQKQRKGKHNYAEEQEYLDASYEPSYQEDSTIIDNQDPSQMTRFQSNDMEGEISQQLLNDIQAPAGRASQEPDDLAPLPEDPDLLPDLENGKAEVGMTIAFKQLDCSATTNWQPQMSAYRTAILIATPESGELHLTLAMRDRKQNNFDEATGERIYDKFEMPESDDGLGEDDGTLNLSFSEMYDPKIVQKAPANLNNGPFLADVVTLGHESAEAQLSHVTDTPLHSDAPESNQPKETVEEFHEAPQQPVIEYVMDEPTHSINDDDAFNPATPSLLGGDVDQVDTNVLSEPISDEARQKISHIIKDAGFRSSVASSVIKELEPDGVATPGDAAVFEMLMRDMESRSNPPYSPKFNGIGSSSPVRKRLPSQVPSESQHERSASPAQVQSSWVTIHQEDEAPSSPPEQQGSSSWVTDPEDHLSSPPAKPPTKRNSVKQGPPKRVPTGKAQAAWEAFQPRSRRTSDSSAANSIQTPPNLCVGLDDADEREANTMIQYPKLSVGSSFTSQITDHGRQPDFNFDDSAGLNADTPMAPELEVDNAINNASQVDVESDLPSRNSANEIVDDDEVDNPSYIGPELPRKSAITTRVDALLRSPKNVLDPQQDLPSSDDSFPILEEFFSQHSAKAERATAVATAKPTKEDREYKTAMAQIDEMSDDSDQFTPKASQKHSRNLQSRSSESKISESRTIKSRASQQSPPSQPQYEPRASQSRDSQFVIPQGSQVMDLTLSSDAEPEKDVEESDDSQPSAFKRYDMDDKDDDDFGGANEGGWAAKKSSTVTGVEARRKSGNGLRYSSQASLNTRNKRKGGPKF